VLIFKESCILHTMKPIMLEKAILEVTIIYYIYNIYNILTIIKLWILYRKDQQHTNRREEHTFIKQTNNKKLCFNKEL